jgi:hypothetical protein
MFVSDPVEVTPVSDSKETEYEVASVTSAVLADGLTEDVAVPMVVLQQPATASMRSPAKMLLFMVPS